MKATKTNFRTFSSIFFSSDEFLFPNAEFLEDIDIMPLIGTLTQRLYYFNAPVSALLTSRVSKSQQDEYGSADHCAFLKFSVFQLLSLSVDYRSCGVLGSVPVRPRG